MQNCGIIFYTKYMNISCMSCQYMSKMITEDKCYLGLAQTSC